MQKRGFDWERIEADYRLGKFSLRELSRMHGPTNQVIAKRAKRYGWQKDLSSVVAAGVKAEVIARQVADRVAEGGDRVANSAIAAIQTGADVVMAHRRGLSGLRATLERLHAELAAANAAASVVPDEVVVAVAEQAELSPSDVRAMLEAKSVAGRVAIAKALAEAYVKVVPTERRAHDLDADAGDKSDAQVLARVNEALAELNDA